MFTGIVSGIGRIVSVSPIGAASPTQQPAASAQEGAGCRVLIEAPASYLDDVGLGDSIAVNGACMTVTAFDPVASQFAFDISAESLSKTAGLDRPGKVNLEKALRANDRLGGHLVSGHVDGIGVVSHFEAVGESWELRLKVARELARFIAYKGSITVNGVSLTVNRVSDLEADREGDSEGAGGGPACEFSINLIPHTLAHTTLGGLKRGQKVNLEVDQIARYVERMLGMAP
jgi:riboflavin synthase